MKKVISTDISGISGIACSNISVIVGSFRFKEYPQEETVLLALKVLWAKLIDRHLGIWSFSLLITDVIDTDAPVNTDNTDTDSTETPMISVQCTLKQWHIGDTDFYWHQCSM